MSNSYARRKALQKYVWVLALSLFILPWQACGPTFLPMDGMGFDAFSRRPGSGGNGNGDVYTGMRSLKTLAHSLYQPSLPLTPGPDDLYLRFVKGQQCSASPSGAEHSGALRFLSGEWRLQANACMPTDQPVNDVVTIPYARDVVSWNDQVYGFSERRDDLFTSAYPVMWCRSTKSSGEGLSVVIGEKIIDATPAGDGAVSLTFPADDPALPAGVTFSRNESSPTATYVGNDQLVKTAAVGAMRLDYDPSSGDALGLLLEDERTNIATNSSQLDKWSRSSDVIVGVDSLTSPDGTKTADSFAIASGLGDVSIALPAVTEKTSYTFSIYAFSNSSKAILQYENATPLASATYDLVDETVSAYDGSARAQVVKSYGRWMRLQFSFDHLPGPSGKVKILIGHRPSSPLVLWGGQLERGSYATSYIPTTTTSVTRNADLLTAKNRFFVDGIGALYVKFQPLVGQSDGTAFELGDANNRRLTGDVESHQFSLLSRVGNTFSSSSLGSILGYHDLRVAFALKNDKSTGAISGALRSYEAPLSIGTKTYSDLSFGRRLDGTRPLSGHLRRVTQWNHELAFGTLVHSTGSGTPLPLQGQISIGQSETSGSYERAQVFNFQVDRESSSAGSLRFVAPDYDFDVRITRSPTSTKSGTATIETAIDDKLYRDDLTCVLEPANIN